jgi:hypothetical protein
VQGHSESVQGHSLMVRRLSLTVQMLSLTVRGLLLMVQGLSESAQGHSPAMQRLDQVAPRQMIDLGKHHLRQTPCVGAIQAIGTLIVPQECARPP